MRIRIYSIERYYDYAIIEDGGFWKRYSACERCYNAMMKREKRRISRAVYRWPLVRDSQKTPDAFCDFCGRMGKPITRNNLFMDDEVLI